MYFDFNLFIDSQRKIILRSAYSIVEQSFII